MAIGSGGVARTPEETVRSAANWFFWIAGLSAINSVMTLAGSERGFVLGLGISQVFDALAAVSEGSGKVVAYGLDAAVLALFVWFGWKARRSRGVFLAGMIVYALDGLLFLVAEDWFGLGFHAFALVAMTPGLMALKKLGGEGSLALPEPALPAAAPQAPESARPIEP